MECFQLYVLYFVGARVCESEHRMTRAHKIGSRAWFELEKDIELGTPPHHVLSHCVK